MRQVDGRFFYDTTEELVDPAHTALVLIDIQNDFCARGGTFDRSGYDVSLYQWMIPRTATLLAAARRAGALCVFIQNTTLRGHLSDSPAQVRFRVRLSRDGLLIAVAEVTADGWPAREGKPRLLRVFSPAGASIDFTEDD